MRNKNKFVVFWTKKILQHFFILFSYYNTDCYVRFFVLLQGVQVFRYFLPKNCFVREFYQLTGKNLQILIFDTLYYMKNLSFVTPYFLFTKKNILIQPSSFVQQITNFGCNKNLKYIFHSSTLTCVWNHVPLSFFKECFKNIPSSSSKNINSQILIFVF